MAAVSLTDAKVEPRGARWDRRWMVVDEDGRFLTGRTVPDLVRFRATVAGEALTIAFGEDAILVPQPEIQSREIVVWKDSLELGDCGDEVATWLSRRLKREVRLVFQREDDHRWLAEGKRLHEFDEVSLADGYPLLLIGTASLAALNQSLDRPVTMDRFRPNLVVSTKVPFEEDNWQRLIAGNTPFQVASQCTRCVFTTVDQTSGEIDPAKEPLATLLKTRRRDSDFKPVFGVNLIPEASGEIRQGDPVSVTG